MAGLGGWVCLRAIWRRLPLSMVDTYRVLGKGPKAGVLETALPRSSAQEYGHFTAGAERYRRLPQAKHRRRKKQIYRNFPKYSTTNSDYGRFYHVKGAVLPRTLPV